MIHYCLRYIRADRMTPSKGTQFSFPKTLVIHQIHLFIVWFCFQMDIWKHKLIYNIEVQSHISMLHILPNGYTYRPPQMLVIISSWGKHLKYFLLIFGQHRVCMTDICATAHKSYHSCLILTLPPLVILSAGSLPSLPSLWSSPLNYQFP